MPKFTRKYHNYIKKYEEHSGFYDPYSIKALYHLDPQFKFLKTSSIGNNDELKIAHLENVEKFKKVYSKLDKIFTNGLPNNHNGFVNIKFNSLFINKKCVKPVAYKNFLSDNFIDESIIYLPKDGTMIKYINWKFNFNKKPNEKSTMFINYKRLWKKSINPLNKDDIKSAIKVYKDSNQDIKKLEKPYKNLK